MTWIQSHWPVSSTLNWFYIFLFLVNSSSECFCSTAVTGTWQHSVRQLTVSRIGVFTAPVSVVEFFLFLFHHSVPATPAPLCKPYKIRSLPHQPHQPHHQLHKYNLTFSLWIKCLCNHFLVQNIFHIWQFVASGLWWLWSGRNPSLLNYEWVDVILAT